MKSIITLGLALLATVSSHASTSYGLSELDSEFGFGSGIKLSTKFVNEDFVPNPTTFVTSGYLKSTDQTVADNKQITETRDEAFTPLYLETPISAIKEDNRVTEAKLSVYAPLDFNYIDKQQRKVQIPSGLPKL